MVALFAVGCDKSDDGANQPAKVAVESVVITPSTTELVVDEELELSVEVLPADAKYTIEWITTNSDIVTVDDGKIKGIASGTAIIMAKAGDKTGNCTVTVVSTPVESITLDYHTLELEEGNGFTFSATVLPEDADNKSILWSSSDPNIVRVNGAGSITTLRPGVATITAKAGRCTDECVVTVTAAPLSIGDYYYSDGTWSQALDPTRTPIGVVFYVGDITETDQTLKAEHPHCTHGLVVALDEQNCIAWQSNYQGNEEQGIEGYNDTVGRWIEMYTDYETITSGYELTDNINRPMGYHNTKAIEAFNADPMNATWKVTVMEWIDGYRKEVVAPETSSGWYLGSTKEMSLLVTGEYDKNIWDIGEAGTTVQNMKDLNKKIALIDGATQIGNAVYGMMFYWTSTEHTWDLAGGVLPLNGRILQMFKGDDGLFYFVRPILAF